MDLSEHSQVHPIVIHSFSSQNEEIKTAGKYNCLEGNKTGHAATEVARGWAGVVIKRLTIDQAFGQKKTSKTPKKTVLPTERQTDIGGYKFACTRLKSVCKR